MNNCRDGWVALVTNMPKEVYHDYGVVKKAAALVN
jgi:hypothetical protein